MTEGRDVARAIDALRRGWPIAIDGTAVLAVETADAAALARFDAAGAGDLIVSWHRAVTLKLANQRDAAPAGPVRIARAPWIDLTEAVAIADPARDLEVPMKGPFQTLPLDDDRPARAALRLARLAGLLPAFFIAAGGDADQQVAADAVLAFQEADSLTIASRARMPSRFAERTEIVAFRSNLDATEHIALLIGSPGDAPPVVRVHSECLTGDVLGSLKCDCGPQLEAALAAIAASGWGILLYLRQEGRGIGLINKLRAYALQDQGFDTVDANIRLGFADDERDFGSAAKMLTLLGQKTVRLLTNNPAKAAALAAAGIEVAEQIPLKIAANPHNSAYLDTKKRRSGHQL
ncbi:MAG TPA: GTP cyclohydrolase II [Allosphingosinicella sp.]|nr:GTP cyclohydrolase II [Allosphingosinicella sp.]